MNKKEDYYYPVIGRVPSRPELVSCERERKILVNVVHAPPTWSVREVMSRELQFGYWAGYIRAGHLWESDYFMIILCHKNEDLQIVYETVTTEWINKLDAPNRSLIPRIGDKIIGNVDHMLLRIED